MSTRDQIGKVVVTPTPTLQKKTGFHLLELRRYRGAVLEPGGVYKTWFFKRPGAERIGSSKNQFFPSLITIYSLDFLKCPFSYLLTIYPPTFTYMYLGS